MSAAIQNVHHRGGQDIGAGPAEIAIERQAERGRGSSRCRHRNRQDGIGAQPALVLGAIEFDHLLVDGALVGGVEVGQGVGDFAVHIFYRLQYTLALVALLVAVAQLDRLVLAGGCSAGDGCTSPGSVGQGDFRLDRRIAARIENLPRPNFLNLRDHVHDCWCASFFLCGVTGNYIGFSGVARAPSPARVKGQRQRPRAGAPAPHQRTSPVSMLVPRVFHRLASATSALESRQDVASHGNSGCRLARAGIPVVGRESRRDSLPFRFSVAGSADRGVSARHLVTELRETHGSVGADEK